MSLKITILDDELKDTIIGFESLNDYEIRHVLLTQVIRCEMSSLRSGNAHTKTRAEVRGGGKKPWKQKGTGRARHGSIRSPLWVGGGITFGPRNDRNWTRKINKSSRISALKSILKDRLNEEVVYQLNNEFNLQSTKTAVDIITKLSDKTGVKNHKQNLIVYTAEDKVNLRGVLNTQVSMINANNLKIHKIANSKNLILTPSARMVLEQKVTK